MEITIDLADCQQQKRNSDNMSHVRTLRRYFIFIAD